jgi:aminoglycoside/choline kinase family phosphotransferase
MYDELIKLFEATFGSAVQKVKRIGADGSNRELYHMAGSDLECVGVCNDDREENIAFLEFSGHFHDAGLPVPEIYAKDLHKNVYLEQYLGRNTLFDILEAERHESAVFPEKAKSLYRQVVRLLPDFQIRAGKTLNYDLCYPRHSFDRQSMLWDLNYFKYYFIKLAQIPFNEQQLENDFETLITFLCEADSDFFLYRDFQSRNIMVVEGKPYFIDYQGGRRGALQYDIAALLFDAKADLPAELRAELLSEYLETAGRMTKINHDTFMKYYHGFVLIRLLQAMGAYGFRGFYERKTHFLQSVPFAIRNLENLLESTDLGIQIPALLETLRHLVRSTRLRELGNVTLPLTIRIVSFAYKNGLPEDDTGHGGGFVFDCRSLPNPGRLDAYKNQTGNDQSVIRFLEQEEAVIQFLVRIRDLVSQVVSNYQQRNFSHLQVAFGCTGGQHRSVYCANMLASYLSANPGINIEVTHRESCSWPDNIK